MMTPRERVSASLAHQPVDHAPAAEDFWKDTTDLWRQQGQLGESEDVCDHFAHDIRRAGWMNTVADLDFEPQVLEETAETVLTLDGNGARLRRHKLHASTPEHVGFTVEEREDWERLIKPHLVELDERRIPFAGYQRAREQADRNETFLAWSYVAPFEQMHPVIGHETLLMAMLEDPDWIHDMCRTFVDFTKRHAEALFERSGLPDGIWFYEDMGFKQRPFMSPACYAELLQPYHAELCDWAHGLGRKVILHSCGFVEPLVPGLVEAGIDCLQAMEVKAGMDMPRLAEQFGDRIAFCGNIDVRALCSNDRATIERELQTKLTPLLERGVPWIIHSDHSIPPTVEHDTLHWFTDRAREITAA